MNVLTIIAIYGEVATYTGVAKVFEIKKYNKGQNELITLYSILHNEL